MALTILLADDSMTAQKMGKEILVGAGYQVIAVSNGAAAAKKLADKPDIIILDVFMPGYTGLEICEKVRASLDTAKTPVILTVGKMEHFDPQETARVKADGLIIKPFEPTDLLATIKKLEQKIAADVAADTPSYEKTMVLDRAQIQEFKDASYDEWKVDAAEIEPPPPMPMEMSQEMGSAPAFADDMMTNAPAAAPAFDDTVTYPPAIPTGASAAAASPAFDETVNFPPAIPSAAPDISMDETVNFPPASAPVMAAPTFSAPTFSAPSMDFAPTEAPPMMDMEVVPSAPAPASEIEFTSAPRGVDAKIVVEEGLEADNVDVAIPMQDPALVTDPTTMATEFATKFGVDKEDEEGYVPGFDKPEGEIAPIAVDAPAADDDFEARVAAAMNSYETEAPAPVEVPEAPAAIEMQAMPIPEAVAEIPKVDDTQEMEAVAEDIVPELPASQLPPEGMQDAALVEQMQQAFADLPVAPPAPVEEPLVAAEVAPIPPPPATATNAGPDMELANALAAAVGGEAPQAAAATAGGHDHQSVAAAVGRVMERMLPSIMHEVAKELDSSKK